MDPIVPAPTGVAPAAAPSLNASTAQPPHVESYAIPDGSTTVQVAGVSEPDARMGEDNDKEKRPRREGAWSSSPAANSLTNKTAWSVPSLNSPRISDTRNRPGCGLWGPIGDLLWQMEK